MFLKLLVVFAYFCSRLCCGEVVSCVVVGDQDCAPLKGDNYTTYCLPQQSPMSPVQELNTNLNHIALYVFYICLLALLLYR